jgi:DNA-binding SARP family transcriptional activator
VCFRVGSSWEFGLLFSPVATALQSVAINDSPAAVHNEVAAARPRPSPIAAFGKESSGHTDRSGRSGRAADPGSGPGNPRRDGSGAAGWIAGGAVEFRLLGAVEAWEQNRQLDLGPRQQRFLLAVLALKVNQLVPVDRLIDLTWPDSPPHTARHAIHVRVSQLRAVLANARADRADVGIITRGPTYALQADPMCVDAHRFRALVTEARTATNDATKAALLRRALDMWHGPPLADVAGAPADRLCRGLEEARLAALEEWLDAELRLGRHEAILDELAESAGQHPYRQRLLAQLMLALYRAGRAPDALVAYRLARSRLVDELGLDPGLQLQKLEKAILRADPALELSNGRARAHPESTARGAASPLVPDHSGL